MRKAIRTLKTKAVCAAIRTRAILNSEAGDFYRIQKSIIMEYFCICFGRFPASFFKLFCSIWRMSNTSILKYICWSSPRSVPISPRTMMMLAKKQTGTGDEKLFDVYLTKVADKLSPLLKLD